MLASRLGTTGHTRGTGRRQESQNGGPQGFSMKWRRAGGVWVSLLARGVKRVQLRSSAGRFSVLLGVRQWF